MGQGSSHAVALGEVTMLASWLSSSPRTRAQLSAVGPRWRGCQRRGSAQLCSAITALVDGFRMQCVTSGRFGAPPRAWPLWRSVVEPLQPQGGAVVHPGAHRLVPLVR